MSSKSKKSKSSKSSSSSPNNQGNNSTSSNSNNSSSNSNKSKKSSSSSSNKEKMKKKRKREAEEADLYMTAPQRRGTSNRRERGSARDRMPHVIFADRLESIRTEVEKREGSVPFHRPVNRRTYPKYYEVISNPVDLQTIRDRNQSYQYKTTDAFLRDFDLMKNNAIKFNGMGSILGNVATDIYEFVKNKFASNRSDFDAMEKAVKEQMNKSRKKGRSSTSSSPVVASSARSPSSSSSNATPSAAGTNGGGGKKGGSAPSSSSSSSSSSAKGSGMNTTKLDLDGVETTVNLGDIESALGDSDSDEDLAVLLS